MVWKDYVVFLKQFLLLANSCSGYLKSESHLPKKSFFIFFNEGPLKIMEEASFFHLKSSFRYQDIKIFALTFSLYRKNDLIRKVRLI